MVLSPCVVGRTDERPGQHVSAADLVGLVAQLGELLEIHAAPPARSIAQVKLREGQRVIECVAKFHLVGLDPLRRQPQSVVVDHTKMMVAFACIESRPRLSDLADTLSFARLMEIPVDVLAVRS